MNKYTTQGRLADVIALISLLSVDEGTFRTISNLDTALRGTPKSAEKWENIAESHPEFFRFNDKRNCIALLIRSYFPEDENKRRAPLTVSETQKQIDTAIALHDKELQYRQRNSHFFPIIVSLISLMGLIFTTVLTTVYNARSNNSVIQKIDSLDSKIKRIDAKIKP